MRYHRQSILPEVGNSGLIKLQSARVLLVGVGGLGSPAALYLAGAGVGTLGMIDADVVSLSNLHRQVLYTSEDVGTLKVDAAKKRLLALNPDMQVKTFPSELSASNVLEIFSQFDVIIEGSDRFATKLLTNDACLKLNLPWVYASVAQWEGQTAIFDPRDKKSACYRCLRPKLPEVPVQNCEQSGAMGPVVGILGVEQALQAIQIVLNNIPKKAGVLRIFDGLSLEWMNVKIQKNPDCKFCQKAPSEILIQNEIETARKVPEVFQKTVKELKADLANPKHKFSLIDVREQDEWDQFHIEGAIHWPLSKLNANEFPTLSKDEEIVLYCRSGKRSLTAALILKNFGYSLVSELKAGLSEWA